MRKNRENLFIEIKIRVFIVIFLKAVMIYTRNCFCKNASFFVCALSDPDTKKRENRRENDDWEWFMFVKSFFRWSIKEGNFLSH